MVEGGSCDPRDDYILGRRWPRVRYGDEETPPGAPPDDLRPFCHDCNAAKGGYHHFFCDFEECPCCHGQSLGCECIRGSGRWNSLVEAAQLGSVQMIKRIWWRVEDRVRR
jgi:hypothetical protein